MSLPPQTTLGAARLRVADLDALTEFYERVVGLSVLARDGDLVRMGGAGASEPALELLGSPGAPRRPAYSSGLYHNAFLVPSRPDLARALRRIAGAGWRLTGASDHLVSEAIYLRDPEGNGIEIYRDRSRDEWPFDNGRIRMASDPLDLQDIVAELDADEPEPGPGDVAAGTKLGHVHLQAGALEPTGDFYEHSLGLDMMVRWLPGALFLSAGGYHHHVGLNEWETRGAPRPPEGALGLDRYELVLPDAESRDATAERLGAAGFAAEDGADGPLVRDPGGVGVLLRVG
jgi:catechol 2,3-dioxygenase